MYLIVVLCALLLGSFTGSCQTASDPRDAIQQAANYYLKGLPIVEIVRLKGFDQFQKYSLGAVTPDQMYFELAAVLKRFRVPVTVSVPCKGYTMHDNVAALFISYRTVGHPGDANANFTIRIEVQESAVLKREPMHKGSITEWEDEQEIDSPSVNARDQFLDAIRTLGERFALAYLAANR